MNDHSTFTREEAKEIAKEAVREVLIDIGIDTRDPLETQQDMAWVRKTRKGISSAVIAVVSAVFLGAAGALATWFHTHFGGARP